MKNAIYLFQGIIIYVAFFLFSILPLDVASGFGGRIGRVIGMRLGATRRAYRHIEMAMPGTPKEEQKKIVLAMWDNLGRTLAEYPHLEKIARDRTVIENNHILKQTTQSGDALILIAAHLANWEVNGASLYVQHGRPLHLTYRAMNNPYADKLLMKARTMGGKMPAYPKSRESGRQILNALKNKECLGILIDQKYNEGTAVPFFGIPAMTNPVFVQLAQKYKCPLVFVQTIRNKGADFTIRVQEPIRLFDENGLALPIENIIAETHLLLERWIRENPGQWLWLHRRWDSKALKEKHEEAL